MTDRFVISPVRQLVTLNPRYITDENPLGVIENGAVAVNNGVIEYVGPLAGLTCKYPQWEGFDASDLVLMPGLIDSHTHLVFGGDRSAEYEMKVRGVPYQEIARQGGGILATVRATREASADELLRAALPRLAEALRWGVTTMEVKSGYGLDTDTELKQLEVVERLNDLQPVELIPTFMGAHDFPPEYRDDRDGYVDMIVEEMIPAVARQGIARFIDVFCEKGWFTPEQTRRILTAGVQAGLYPRLHADEFAPSGACDIAAEFEAASADHLMAADDAGIRALAAAGVIGTVLPGTTLFLGKHDYAPVRDMIAMGLKIAVATDFNPGSCMTQNLPLAAQIACMQAGLLPHEAVAGITVNAAQSLRIADRLGTLEQGREADLVGLAIPSWQTFLYHFGVNHTELVFKHGALVYERPRN